VITYPDRANPGAGTENGKQFPRRKSLAADGRRVEIR
jgi:hypothetical protein